jgi:hypothetical protein
VFLLAAIVRLILAVLALRGVRWAYVAFIVVGLAYFPARMGFHLEPRACALVIDRQGAMLALGKQAHVILFALFFILSSAQTGAKPSDRTVLLFSSIATLVMGALVELAEGVTGAGNCRLRDLIPDSVGILLGAAVLIVWRKLRGADTLNAFARWRLDSHIERRARS